MPTRRKASTASKASASRVPQSADTPTPADIAARAYSLFLERGRSHGHDWEDWLQAEKELLSAGPEMIAAGGR